MLQWVEKRPGSKEGRFSQEVLDVIEKMVYSRPREDALATCARCNLSKEQSPLEFDRITKGPSEQLEQLFMGFIGDIWSTLGACNEAYKVSSSCHESYFKAFPNLFKSYKLTYVEVSIYLREISACVAEFLR